MSLYAKWWNNQYRIMELLCDAMNALDEDFVPGPKLADLENRFHKLTGLHRGDEL